MNEYMNRKRSVGMKWMQAESGNSYLCPIDVVKNLDNPTEEDFKRLCVNESHNPQND